MRDFRAELEGEPCWDRDAEASFDTHGEVVGDVILQNREELVALCRFIEAYRIRSYLEIGIWTGRLVRTLHRLFHFDTVAACDDGYARRFGLSIELPAAATFLEASSHSDAFRAWRAALGHIDLVLIDANHAYHAVKQDFAINRGFPHRFLAFHDISGYRRQTRGVRRFWNELAGGKLEILRPHRDLGLDHTTMGIGIWSHDPRAFDQPLAGLPSSASNQQHARAQTEDLHLPSSRHDES